MARNVDMPSAHTFSHQAGSYLDGIARLTPPSAVSLLPTTFHFQTFGANSSLPQRGSREDDFSGRGSREDVFSGRGSQEGRQGPTNSRGSGEDPNVDGDPEKTPKKWGPREDCRGTQDRHSKVIPFLLGSGVLRVEV